MQIGPMFIYLAQNNPNSMQLSYVHLVGGHPAYDNK
jgi:hypothetical protein